jgi:DNA-binding MarR family transcriptional regulator
MATASASKGTPLDRSMTWRWHLVSKLSDRVTAQAYQDELGLSLGEARCLSAIGQFAPLSVKDLARRANLDKANASRAAQSLMQRGLVVKAANRDDGRGVVLGLTAAGRPLWRRTMRLVERRNREIFGCLAADERRALDAILDRVVAHLEASEGA